MANPIKWLGNQVVGAVTRNIENKLRQTGEIAAERARGYASVKTGAMRAGIGFIVANRTLTLYGTAPWTVFQNSGTRTIPAQHFMERGLNEAGKIVLGASLEIAYPNTPTYARPIFYHRGGYVLPNNLTRGQRRHVAEHLLPQARHHYRGNARRAGLRVGGG